MIKTDVSQVIPEGWSLFPNIDGEIVPLVPADIWHCIVQYLPPIDALRFRCNTFFGAVIPNSFHWKDTVEVLFPKSIYQAKTPFENFLYNQRIHYNMQREICSKQIVPCLKTDDPHNGGFTATHLSENYLFVGSNSGLVEWFDRENLQKVADLDLNAWRDTGRNAYVSHLKEIGGILCAEVYSYSDETRLYLIDLDSKKVRFHIDSTEGRTTIPFCVLGNSVCVLDSKETIGIYNLESGKLEKRVCGLSEQKGQEISHFTIDQEKGHLYALDLNETDILKIRVFDFYEQIPTEEEPKEIQEITLRHLYDLKTESPDSSSKFEFYGSELYLYSINQTINSWKINVEDRSLDYILNLSTPTAWVRTHVIAGDYLFTDDLQGITIRKRNGEKIGIITRGNIFEIPNNCQGGYISAHKTHLAIAYRDEEVDYEKTKEKAEQMYQGTSYVYNPLQYQRLSHIEILNFDVDIPESIGSKVQHQFESTIEQFTLECEKIGGQIEELKETCSIQ